jgi:hypothetical protein
MLSESKVRPHHVAKVVGRGEDSIVSLKELASQMSRLRLTPHPAHLYRADAAQCRGGWLRQLQREVNPSRWGTGGPIALAATSPSKRPG